MSTSNTISYWEDGQESLVVLQDYFSHLCSALRPDFILERDKIALTQNTITVFGKKHLEPRLTAWMGPPYQYSDIRWQEQKMTPLIQEMNREISERCSFPFNAVLINYYRNGQDSMGKHRDNEPEIDQHMIASVSFGASRLIRFTCPERNQTIDVLLHHGDLMLMKNMQKRWWHELPKRKSILHPRLNLTFRKIL